MEPSPHHTGGVRLSGPSRQDYGTPWELIHAIERRYGMQFNLDLAATEKNAKANAFITPEQNSLTTSWTAYRGMHCWLNPPFSNIAPWAKKCSEHPFRSESTIYLLVPASIGSEWFAKYVYEHAELVALRGRITYEGESSPYPKDCLLAVYHPVEASFPWSTKLDVWDWRKQP